MWLLVILFRTTIASPAYYDWNSICYNGPVNCDPKYPFRSFNGSCNNIQYPMWAMAMTPYNRLLPNTYADGKYAWPLSFSGEDLPKARRLSIKLNPPGIHTDKRYTMGLMQFGQIVAHDFSLLAASIDIGNYTNIDCCTNGQIGKDILDPKCQPIMIPAEDPIYVDAGIKCLPFLRTITSYDKKCTAEEQPAEPLTVVTGYADLSNIYGTNDEVARSLRAFQKGLMVTDKRYEQTWPPQAVCQNNVLCYRGGDRRMNQNPQLTVLQTSFLRQHNRIAHKLEALNPHWDDEKIYQESRRINIAMYQHIMYMEYIPRIIGTLNALDKNLIYDQHKGCINDYDTKVDASVVVEFATAAFRALHSQITGNIHLISEYREYIGELRLSDYLNMATIIEANNTIDQCDVNYDYLTRGMGYQHAKKADKYFDEEIKHFLYRGNHVYGSDLRAIDIQRQRDHGVGTYVQARTFCNLSVPTTFKDLLKYMPQENVGILRNIYRTVGDIDITTGGLSEHVERDALVGPTFRCIIETQFYRTRVGDRYFYENCEAGAFTPVQLNEIRKATFSCLLCENSYCIEDMQPNGFDAINENNRLTNCDNLCQMDFTIWEERSKLEPLPNNLIEELEAMIN